MKYIDDINSEALDLSKLCSEFLAQGPFTKNHLSVEQSRIIGEMYPLCEKIGTPVVNYRLMIYKHTSDQYTELFTDAIFDVLKHLLEKHNTPTRNKDEIFKLNPETFPQLFTVALKNRTKDINREITRKMLRTNSFTDVNMHFKHSPDAGVENILTAGESEPDAGSVEVNKALVPIIERALMGCHVDILMALEYSLEGKSYTEIGKLLNIPKGTVKSRINNVKNRLPIFSSIGDDNMLSDEEKMDIAHTVRVVLKNLIKSKTSASVGSSSPGF